MKPLAEEFAVEHGCEMEDTDTGETLVCRNCTHLAALAHEWFAEWLTSSEAVEAVADTLMIHTQFYDVAARHALADLAAHAKGEAND